MGRVQQIRDGRLCLLKYLYNRSEELSGRLAALEKKAVESLLPFTQLEDFTDHGVKHAYNVQENLWRLIPREMPEPLSPFELFCLLCAVTLHDVGMATSKSPNERAWQIRLDHFERSRDFVIENQKELNLTEHEALIVGEICRAHGMPNLKYLEEPVFSIHKYGTVRVPLLSAFLRLADSLDMTTSRAPSIIGNNRMMSAQSRQHWDIHSCISDVQIEDAPSWDIRIISFPKNTSDEHRLYELRNTLQNELDTIYPVLRVAGVFFKKIELMLNLDLSDEPVRMIKNPFFLLAAFGSRNAHLFTGRTDEIQQMVERILRRRLVMLIGESGVGKTSLVEAGVIPKLRTYRYKVIRFSFQDDPVASLAKAISKSPQNAEKTIALVNVIRTYCEKHGKLTKLLLIGDHLEQMFTISKSQQVRIDFVQHLSRVLGSSLPVTFLFCIREDYLPDLYNLSLDLPDLYVRDNTFRLHRLSRESGIEVFEKASQYATVKLSKHLIKRVVDDLCYEGEGAVYPPYLQIVGHGLYTALGKRQGAEAMSVIPESSYDNLGRVEKIVNNYIEGLLDQYQHHDKSLVGLILSTMVTEQNTKKRVSKEELHQLLPECHSLDRLLSSLVQHRIIRRSLGQYELIHDFLARRVVEFIQQGRYLSSPVRAAIGYMEENYHRTQLSSREVSCASGVSQTYLAFLFRKELGNSINKQLNRIRIARAKELLRSQEQLGDIVNRVGFRSASNFSRKFKEIQGVSPLGYRKEFFSTKS